MDTVTNAFEKGFSAGRDYGAALAITSVLKLVGEEKLGESTTAKSFLEGFADGKRQSALKMVAPILSLFDIGDEEKENKIRQAASFLGCSAEEIRQAVSEEK
ncbi:MAG: hypothetical protein HFG28_15335 [Eubacterium sp.]|nr:hypothetical protein [Eubacterium sp.]